MRMEIKYSLTLILGFCFYLPVHSQSSESNATDLDQSQPYCFEFTWFGPEYDSKRVYNGTCEDYLDSARTKNVPCSPPIVISDDGSPPDIDWLFQNHKASVLCRRAKTQVCATYTYKSNGQVLNATHMCTKIKTPEGGSVGSGCYTQTVDGYQTELCVCTSSHGSLTKPCNSALNISSQFWLIIFIPILISLRQYFTRSMYNL